MSYLKCMEKGIVFQSNLRMQPESGVSRYFSLFTATSLIDWRSKHRNYIASSDVTNVLRFSGVYQSIFLAFSWRDWGKIRKYAFKIGCNPNMTRYWCLANSNLGRLQYLVPNVHVPWRTFVCKHFTHSVFWEVSILKLWNCLVVLLHKLTDWGYY